MKLFASAKGEVELTLEFVELTLEFIEEITVLTVTDLRESVLQSYPKLAQIPFCNCS